MKDLIMCLTNDKNYIKSIARVFKSSCKLAKKNECLKRYLVNRKHINAIKALIDREFMEV